MLAIVDQSQVMFIVLYCTEYVKLDQIDGVKYLNENISKIKEKSSIVAEVLGA